MLLRSPLPLPPLKPVRTLLESAASGFQIRKPVNGAVRASNGSAVINGTAEGMTAAMGGRIATTMDDVIAMKGGATMAGGKTVGVGTTANAMTASVMTANAMTANAMTAAEMTVSVMTANAMTTNEMTVDGMTASVMTASAMMVDGTAMEVAGEDDVKATTRCADESVARVGATATTATTATTMIGAETGIARATKCAKAGRPS